jgi:hypothetical protein
MAQTLDIAGAGTVGSREPHPVRPVQNLERPGDVFRDLGPNWFCLGDGHGW